MRKCLSCGNNPTSHFLSWFHGSFAVLIFSFQRTRFGRRFGKALDRMASPCTSLFLRFLRFTRLLRFTDDIRRVGSARGKVLWEEALERGIHMECAVILGKSIDYYRAVVAGKPLFFMGLPQLQGSNDDEEECWDDKAFFKSVLLEAGIPVARGGSFSRFSSLRATFDTLEKPVILKPRLGSRGRHTTTLIHTEKQLRAAFTCAKKLCHWVVMEEHLMGNVYRGTLVEGALVGVLSGCPPRVTGDGTHTIAELIHTANRERHPRVADIPITPVLKAFLARSCSALTDILPRGTTIDLSEKIGVSYGGKSAEVTAITHPVIKETLERAARVVHDPIIGFDFIIADITRDPTLQKWGLIECNAVPFINLHHDPLEGPPNNVARHVWDAVERSMDKILE